MRQRAREADTPGCVGPGGYGSSRERTVGARRAREQESRDELQRLALADLHGPLGGDDEEFTAENLIDRYPLGSLARRSEVLEPDELDAADTGGDARQAAVAASATGGTVRLRLAEGLLTPQAPDSDQPDVVVRGRVRKHDGNWLVSLFLENRQSQPNRTRHAPSWIFQVRPSATGSDDRPAFLPRPERSTGGDHDDAAERRRRAMAYRFHPEFTSGSGAAVPTSPREAQCGPPRPTPGRCPATRSRPPTCRARRRTRISPSLPTWSWR